MQTEVTRVERYPSIAGHKTQFRADIGIQEVLFPYVRPDPLGNVSHRGGNTMRNHQLEMFGLMILLFGCSDQGVNLDSPGPVNVPMNSAINGKTFTCSLNQTFSLELDLNADAGYQWDHSISDTSILHLDSTNYRPQSGDKFVDGGLTVETFYFRITSAGRCTIDLIQHRGWESGIRPIQTVHFAVVVQPR